MQFSKLMNHLDLGQVKAGPVEVKGGLLHKMYQVITTQGVFAVKVLDSQIMKRPAALKNTINSERIAAIMGRSLPVVAALKIQEVQVHEWEGQYYMIFPWVEGKSVFPPKITEEHCSAIGDILGQMHRMNVKLDDVEPENQDATIYEWDSLLQQTKAQGAPAKSWLPKLEEAIEDIKLWTQKAHDSQTILAKHMVISHRDLDPKNIMWKELKPFVIDWEAAGYVNPYQELLEIINYWADDGNGGLLKGHFDAIMTAYKRHSYIGDVDWDSVFAGSYMGMLGWLEYNVKRALGIEVVSAEGIALGEKQVMGTIKALYEYGEKIKLLKTWI